VTRTRDPSAAEASPLVGLFVTCLVDLFRPSVGFAAVRLLEAAGCRVVVPRQTCCGQPAFNSGDRRAAQAIARQIMRDFAACDHVVVPSGSCGGMLARHLPELFKDDPDLLPQARAFAAKCHELLSFLVDVRKVSSVDAEFPRRVTYHDACSGLRELGVRSQPRRLLSTVRGLDLVESPENEACCGFGGTFAVKFGAVSDSIVARKADWIQESGASVILAGDLGCLMNIAGKLSRRGSAIETRHVAEVLAGMTSEPAIGAPRKA
jgi:L-lactate dehydrogenase complex protein LldE